MHFTDAQQFAELRGGHFHGARGRRGPGAGCGKPWTSPNESDVAFHLLHHLVNVPVQHRHRTEALQQRQGLRAVLRWPSPTPDRRDHSGNMREHHNRRAGGDAGEVLLRANRVAPAPSTPRPSSCADIVQSDEVDALVVEALPAAALGSLAEPLQVMLAVVASKSCSPGT